MKFLFPTFLFALVGIVIPVVIHLFSFRQHKTVYFSHVDFLKNIRKESKKKSNLKKLLLLISRILTIVFLVFAFARPFVPYGDTEHKETTETVAIYIDNSFSMNALSEKGQLLEVARTRAIDICQAYPAGTRYWIYTNDLLSKHQAFLNKEQFIRHVSEIRPTPRVIPLSVIYNRFTIQPEIEKAGGDLYIISDFQRSVTDFENFNENKANCYIIPLIPVEVANIYIDSCWTYGPTHRLNNDEEINVRIKNSSGQSFQNLPLKLFLNDSLKSITNFSVSANNEIIAQLKYTNKNAGYHLGRIEISDYPFAHDNTWYISYFVQPGMKALAVYDESSESQEAREYMNALFENDEYIHLDETNIRSLQISKLNEYNAIFLLNISNFSSGFITALNERVKNGGSVVIFPGIDRNSNNTLLSQFNANIITGWDSTMQKISGIDFESELFRDVFKKKEDNVLYPEIAGNNLFERRTRTTETALLWFQNGNKALSMLKYEKGKCWIFSFPLLKKNESFARDVLFVPTLYNIVLNSGPEKNLSYIVGENQVLNIDKKIRFDSRVVVEKSGTGEQFIPSSQISHSSLRLDISDRISDAGHYEVRNREELITVLAFNFDRKESSLSYFGVEELKDRILQYNMEKATIFSPSERDFTEVYNEIQSGKQLWKLCILFALFFLVCETLIARFMK